MPRSACRCRPIARRRDRSARWSHGHASKCMIMLMGSPSASSGRRATPAPSCCASSPRHPDLEVVYATGDTQAGRAGRHAVPEPDGRLSGSGVRAVRRRRGRRARPRLPRSAARGQHGARPDAARAGRVPGRPLGRLPPQGPVAVPDVVRLRARPARRCWPTRSTGCRSCTGRELQGARLVATPGLLRDGGVARPRPARAARVWSSPRGSSSTPPPV